MTTATTWDGVTWTWTEPGEDKPLTDAPVVTVEEPAERFVRGTIDGPDGVVPRYESVRLAARRLELRSADVRGRMVS